MNIEGDIQHWDQSKPLTAGQIIENRSRWNRAMFMMLADQYAQIEFKKMGLLDQMRQVADDLVKLPTSEQVMKPNIVKGFCRFWGGCKPF